MLLGVTPKNHQLTNYIAGREVYDANTLIPSVFRVFRENEPDAVMASFRNWTLINKGIVDDNIKIYKDGGIDEEITGKVCAYVAEFTPKFLFVQFNDRGYGDSG